MADFFSTGTAHGALTNIKYVWLGWGIEHIMVLICAFVASQANVATIFHICHGYHGRCPWRKNLPCGEISAHDILLLEEILHMTEWHIEKVLHVRNVNTICKLDKWCVQFMVFCRIKLILCVKKLSQKLCLWRKKDKYDVWIERGSTPVHLSQNRLHRHHNMNVMPQGTHCRLWTFSQKFIIHSKKWSFNGGRPM